MESTNSLSWVGDDSEEDAQESGSYFFRLYSFVFFTLLELFKVQIVGLNKKYVLTTNIYYYNGLVPIPKRELTSVKNNTTIKNIHTL